LLVPDYSNTCYGTGQEFPVCSSSGLESQAKS
jgi:hypothetical protein